MTIICVKYKKRSYLITFEKKKHAKQIIKMQKMKGILEGGE